MIQKEIEIKYFDRINLQNTVIEVGKPFKVNGGSNPGVYKAIEIQLHDKTILVWAFVKKHLTCFSDDEIIGIWQK